MDVPVTSEEQKEASPNKIEEVTVIPAIANSNVSIAGAPVSKTASASTSGHREPAGQAMPARGDKYAEKRLARKKKMRAAHRRRLKASYAKG